MEKLFAGTNEEQAPVEGIVKGTLPTWICGSLFRNGPAMNEIGGQKFNHLFDGLAAVQKFEIRNGRAWYSRKFIQSQSYKKNMAANKIVVSEFGTLAYYSDPCKTLFQRFLAYFLPDEPTDNTSVSVWPLKDRLFASTETNIIHEIDPDNLDTIDRVDIKKYVTADTATAHPHWDPDGTVHNIGYSYGRHSSYCLLRVPAKEGCKSDMSDIELVASVKSRWSFHPGYYHSFAVTENYYIFLEQPLVVNILKVLTSKLRGISFDKCVEWYPNEKTLIHIIDKKTGEKINSSFSYESDAFFVFHHANAFEEDGHIIMDMCCYRDGSIVSNLSVDKMRENYGNTMKGMPSAELKRFVLPLNVEVKKNENLVKLKGTDATAIQTSDTCIYCTGENFNIALEFPQVNYLKNNGKKYRYLYGVLVKGDGLFNTLSKVDMEVKSHKEWTQKDCNMSEPIFVASPDALNEDDGVILSAVNSIEEGKNAFLLVLDAKSFQEIARVDFQDVCFSRDFHGIFRNAQV